jgi:hypothetical protein
LKSQAGINDFFPKLEGNLLKKAGPCATFLGAYTYLSMERKRRELRLHGLGQAKKKVLFS